MIELSNIYGIGKDKEAFKRSFPVVPVLNNLDSSLFSKQLTQ